MSSDDVSSRLPSVLCMPKVVRDLLWTVTSPHMLSGDRFPVLPAEFGVEALKFDSVVDWLLALVADPAPLLAFLQQTTAQGKSLALGVYFSTLLEYWLRFCPHLRTEKMEIGKQIVSSTNRTVGQLKFLFRCNFELMRGDDKKQRDFHVESSVKFFLLNPIESEVDESLMLDGVDGDTGHGKKKFVPLEKYVGPHLGENLAWRVQEVERKLAMRRGESVRMWLQENYSEHVQSYIVLRGYLFQPLKDLVSTSETTVAHDWFFHRKPAMLTHSANGYSSNPSIAANHLRGWWTTDMETDLPTKVLANDRAVLGESRFVILPKLHWLSPVVALEDMTTGRISVDGDDRLDIPHVESLSLDELMASVREHFKKVASSVETNKSGGVAMPLLVAEIVRYSNNQELVVENGHVLWYELSRGFILDPKCWDPSPLCHEPVRFRRTLRRNNASGLGGREYEVRRIDCSNEGFIKPDADEAAAQDKQKQHRFNEPESVGPQELSLELLSCLKVEDMEFSHADLKRSTKELILWRRQHAIHSNSDTDVYSKREVESAYLRSCLEVLITSAHGEDESRVSRRVGYLLLDVFDGLKANSSSAQSCSFSVQECSNWTGLLADVACDEMQWDFLNLILRAIDLTINTADLIEWRGSEKSVELSFLDKLLAMRSARWNSVVVEVIRVFRMGELVPGHNKLKSTKDARIVRSVFDELIEQCDWPSAERLVTVVQDHDLLQTLVKHLSLLNMTKALKRLRKNVAVIQKTWLEYEKTSALPSNEYLKADEVRPHLLGHPIDHAKNRLMVKNQVLEFKWKYIGSQEEVEEVTQHLKKQEAALYLDDDLSVVQTMLIGIDCEWRPQFLTKERTVDTEYVLSGKDSNNQIDEDQSGLSIYQLAVGDIVYVIDVQVLGQAASAPLSYIWRPTSRLLLIGFCVSSDIQRIKSSFPELRVLFARTNETTHDVAPLLLELKELALFRHVPAKNWGLSRLYRACLGGQVDKEQQCSDWGSRPLSSDQLEYAAKDAYVVQRLTLHLLADVKFTCVGAEKDSVSDRIMNYMKCFDASSFYSQSWMASISQPLEKQHVKDALEALGIPARFEKCDDSSEGLLVKSIALVIRKEKVSNAPRRLSYAVAVLSLQRSIDMQSLASLLRVDPEDVFLADQETLVRVFGYSRGCLGPIGLREQKETRVILDDRLQTEPILLCGAGIENEVYPIAPRVLLASVDALVGSISK